MQHRNVLSRFFRVTAAALVTAAAFAAPAHAEVEGYDSFRMLALMEPTRGPSVAAIEDALTVHELRTAPQLPGTIDLTAPTDNLWVRIRNGFAMPNLNDDVVLHHQQWFMNRPDLLRRIVERSRRYMHHIVEELERRGMPTELALLPMVESSYNPMAFSKAQAAGLWQFIPATGKRYNLEQNWWQDQRRDIVASTAAALDYLQAIYEMNGDWQLALASYNWGEGAVKRAMEKNAARGLPTDYSSLTMPAETRNYVPKLQALKNIFSNPVLMAELKLPELMNQPYFATVETTKPMDVQTAAKLARMPVQEFLALNPAHNRPVMQADSTLVIPADKLQTFQANLESHDEPLSQWQAYTLKPGEKLEKVAPRFGIALNDLKRVNGIQGRIKVGAGSTLLVPAGKGADVDDMPAQPRLPQIAAAEPKGKRGVAKAGKESAQVARGSNPAKGGKAVAVAKAERKAPAKVAAAKPAPKVASKPAPARTAAAKPAPAAKVAKAGNGRRT